MTKPKKPLLSNPIGLVFVLWAVSLGTSILLQAYALANHMGKNQIGGHHERTN
jgi:hypothetical protein